MSKMKSLLAAMTTTVMQAVQQGADADDAAWEVVCQRTNHLSYDSLVALAALAFPNLSTREVLNRYADAGHESNGAILQSALMDAITTDLARA